jgi:ribosomal protein S18 acetylase RimI-like enzyme
LAQILLDGYGGKYMCHATPDQLKEVFGLGGQLYLSVRQENTTACQFHERHGMKVVGSVEWSSGTIRGRIYLRDVG